MRDENKPFAWYRTLPTGVVLVAGENPPVGEIWIPLYRAPTNSLIAEEMKQLRSDVDCACNALKDSILCSGNDADTNLAWVRKLRKLAFPHQVEDAPASTLNANADVSAPPPPAADGG